MLYEGRKPRQPRIGGRDIAGDDTGDIPEQKAGWQEMIFARRRPELYEIIPTTNEVIRSYCAPKSMEVSRFGNSEPE